MNNHLFRSERDSTDDNGFLLQADAHWLNYQQKRTWPVLDIHCTIVQNVDTARSYYPKEHIHFLFENSASLNNYELLKTHTLFYFLFFLTYCNLINLASYFDDNISKIILESRNVHTKIK
jgi:hypothetical protein